MIFLLPYLSKLDNLIKLTKITLTAKHTGMMKVRDDAKVKNNERKPT